MKHQISKVATIATLAFIGVGFAGMQEAKAGNCKPDKCSYYHSQKCNLPIPANGTTNGVQYGEVGTRPSSNPLDCTGNCKKIDVTFTVVYFKCIRLDADGKVVPKSAWGDDYDMFVI